MDAVNAVHDAVNDEGYALDEGRTYWISSSHDHRRLHRLPMTYLGIALYAGWLPLLSFECAHRPPNQPVMLDEVERAVGAHQYVTEAFAVLPVPNRAFYAIEEVDPGEVFHAREFLPPPVLLRRTENEPEENHHGTAEDAAAASMFFGGRTRLRMTRSRRPARGKGGRVRSSLRRGRRSTSGSVRGRTPRRRH